jgi:hypothetical protein
MPSPKNIQTSEQIGPGKYHSKYDMKLSYQENPHAGFASKTVRHFSKKTGEIAHKFIIEKVKQQAKNLLGNEGLLDEQQFDFIDVPLIIPGQLPRTRLLPQRKRLALKRQTTVFRIQCP